MLVKKEEIPVSKMDIKDFIIWEHSFSQYFRLFTNFLTGVISADSFVDDFFYLFNEDQKLLENFVFNSENLKNLNVNRKSFGLFYILNEIAIKCEFFQDDSDIRLPGEIDENQLRSYITKKLLVLNFSSEKYYIFFT